MPKIALFVLGAMAFAGSALAYDIPSVNYWTGEISPIWSGADAARKCPRVCRPFGGWSGSWTTTIPNRMSVCGCKIDPNIVHCQPGPGTVLN